MHGQQLTLWNGDGIGGGLISLPNVTTYLVVHLSRLRSKWSSYKSKHLFLMLCRSTLEETLLMIEQGGFSNEGYRLDCPHSIENHHANERTSQTPDAR